MHLGSFPSIKFILLGEITINVCKMMKNRFQIYIKHDINSIRDSHLYQGQLFTHTSPKCVKNSNWSQLLYEPSSSGEDRNFLIKSISSSFILEYLYFFGQYKLSPGGQATSSSGRAGSRAACRFWCPQGPRYPPRFHFILCLPRVQGSTIQ